MEIRGEWEPNWTTILLKSCASLTRTMDTGWDDSARKSKGWTVTFWSMPVIWVNMEHSKKSRAHSNGCIHWKTSHTPSLHRWKYGWQGGEGSSDDVVHSPQCHLSGEQFVRSARSEDLWMSVHATILWWSSVWSTVRRSQTTMGEDSQGLCHSSVTWTTCRHSRHQLQRYEIEIWAVEELLIGQIADRRQRACRLPSLLGKNDRCLFNS